MRATVPIEKVEALAGTSNVLAMDVDEEIKLSNPTPESHGGQPQLPPKAPDASTPNGNPYLPTNEIGAVDFAKKCDGTGVTIGILDWNRSRSPGAAKLITADGWIIGTADAAPRETHAVVWDTQGNIFDLNAILHF